MPRPAIGVCAAPLRARWGPWELDAVLLARADVDAVHRAGGVALLLAPDPAHVEDPDEALDRVDGLLLVGGADGDPAGVGEREAFELALARRALERDLPFLGVDRGLQVMNLAGSGTRRRNRFAVAVRRHPGADEMSRLVAALVAHAAAGRDRAG